MKKLDCIIVGSGIAGITLAWELYRRAKSFLIISNPKLSGSSIIAPGVWNPVVFKRITPTWNATALINTLLPFYQYTEKILNRSYLQEIEILHCINNENEKRIWVQKQSLYPKFLREITCLKKQNVKSLKDVEIICGKVSNCGRLNTSEYIYYSIEFFKTINAYSEKNFNYNMLISQNHKEVEYENIKTQNIVFCEGYLIKNNPHFNFVKLKPAKGEIVEIETAFPVLPDNTILHKQINIIPNGKNKYLLGSNYEWKDIDETPTQNIKEKFLSLFENIFDVEYQIVGHYAGIRPAADRRPILGKHPQLSNFYILNGLGTKGVMLAPYCAIQLADCIFHQKETDKEVSVERFWN